MYAKNLYNNLETVQIKWGAEICREMKNSDICTLKFSI
jgi:hypothetical protein